MFIFSYRIVYESIGFPSWGSSCPLAGTQAPVGFHRSRSVAGLWLNSSLSQDSESLSSDQVCSHAPMRIKGLAGSIDQYFTSAFKFQSDTDHFRP